MVKMVALRPIFYNTRRLKAGDEFDTARDIDAHILIYNKTARHKDTPEVKKVVKKSEVKKSESKKSEVKKPETKKPDPEPAEFEQKSEVKKARKPGDKVEVVPAEIKLGPAPEKKSLFSKD